MVAFRNTKPILHIMMTESIRRGNADILYDRPDGVAIYDRVANAHMLAAADADAARRMFDGIESYQLLTLHDEFTLAEARRRYRFTYFMECLQAVYLKKEIEVLPADIRRLDLSHFDFVHAHYHNIDDPAYVWKRLEAGELFGLFAEDAFAGFIGTHEEGSLGMLEVLPAYRRRGFGETLERFLIAEQLRRGWTPFAQVWPDNSPSIALHEKLGFTLSQERMYWLF